jgi:hypothetical protein
VTGVRTVDVMDRRKAVAIAGAIVASVAGASSAVAANVGLLGFSAPDSRTGRLEADNIADVEHEAERATGATTTTLPTIVVTVDDTPVATSTPPSSTDDEPDPTPATVAPARRPATVGTTPTTVDDHGDRKAQASDDRKADDSSGRGRGRGRGGDDD